MSILKIVPFHTKDTATSVELTKPLRTKCVAVEDFTSVIAELANDMLETVAAFNARGLAANQVGEAVRVIVAVINDDIPTVMVNPVIQKSEGSQRSTEGCLSLPNASAIVTRPDVITVDYQTVDGTAITELLAGNDAATVAHEIDHLDGILMIDSLGPVAKNTFLRKVNKFHRKINRYTTITLPA